MWTKSTWKLLPLQLLWILITFTTHPKFLWILIIHIIMIHRFYCWYNILDKICALWLMWDKIFAILSMGGKRLWYTKVEFIDLTLYSFRIYMCPGDPTKSLQPRHALAFPAIVNVSMGFQGQIIYSHFHNLGGIYNGFW